MALEPLHPIDELENSRLNHQGNDHMTPPEMVVFHQWTMEREHIERTTKMENLHVLTC